jgi:hypothetical protein
MLRIALGAARCASTAVSSLQLSATTSGVAAPQLRAQQARGADAGRFVVRRHQQRERRAYAVGQRPLAAGARRRQHLQRQHQDRRRQHQQAQQEYGFDAGLQEPHLPSETARGGAAWYGPAAMIRSGRRARLSRVMRAQAAAGRCPDRAQRSGCHP